MKQSVLLIIFISMTFVFPITGAASGKQIKESIIGKWDFSKRRVGWTCQIGAGAPSCAQQFREDWRKLVTNPPRIARATYDLLVSCGTLKECIRLGRIEVNNIKNAGRKERETEQILSYLDRMKELKRTNPDEFCADAYQITTKFCQDRNKRADRRRNPRKSQVVRISGKDGQRTRRIEGRSLPLHTDKLEEPDQFAPGALY